MCFALSLMTPPAIAAGGSSLPMPGPGTIVKSSREYVPPVIMGITLHPDKPFYFDFIIDKGNSALSGEEFEEESLRLIKYFLASLAVPDDDLWVNLSPYESDRIIPEKFGRTEMGRDLLAQDYLLKQFTASLMYPEERLGAEFWKRVHQKAQARFGTTDIPVSTFNKVWIVPASAVIHEHGRSAFVAESRLKVMLEEDYRALESNVLQEEEFARNGIGEAYRNHRQAISNEIIREVLIPEIEREVNEGEHFARLRQIYHSLLLATWYKEGMRRSILNQIYSDRNKVGGVEIPDEQTKDLIYEKYVEAFQIGVYNYVKEEFDPDLGEMIPRKYFSGGMNIKPQITVVRNPAAVRQTGDMAILTTQFDVVDAQIRRGADAAVLANDDEARMERGQRLKAVEKVFINQFSLLTGSLTSLLTMYVQTFGFREEDSARAFEELQQSFRTENLRQIFQLGQDVDLARAHAPIADRFERFRQIVTLNLGLVRAEVAAKEEERSVQLLLKMIDETVQFLERVFDRRLQFRAVDIAKEVRDYAEEFENTFNVPVDVRVRETNIGGIKIDRLRMAEVFYILFNNAREAGGEITVTVELSQDKSNVLFHVSDTGNGIAADVLPRIFERGFTTKAAEDTPRGIGLNLAKLIVEMHGGTIEVESQVGIGTDFTLTLPRRVRGPVLTRMVLDVAKEIQAQVPEYQGDRAALRRRLIQTRGELLREAKDRFISVGVVPDAEDSTRATFDLRNRVPHLNLFPDVEQVDGRASINDRIVRHILMYDQEGALTRVMVDPPNMTHLNRTGLPETQEVLVGQDLMILSARFLTGYDTASGQFTGDRTVAPDTTVLFRDAPIAGVDTIGDLAQRDTKILDTSDKAVLVNPYMAETWNFIWDRRQNTLNQNQLSKELGRNRGYINHLSKGKDIPGQELFDQILEVLDVPEEDRPEAQRLLERARENRANVPQSFIDLGKELRDLRRNANAYVFALERAQIKTDTRAEIAAATGLTLATIESLYIGSEILDDTAYEALLDAFQVPNRFHEEARQRLQRQRELEHLAWNKLTERLEITEAYLSQLETGKTLVSRQVLTKLLNEIGAQPDEADAIRQMHKLAVLDQMIVNTGKTTVQLNRIQAPEWRSLVETVQVYYRTYLGTARPADQVTPEEVQWALYYRLAQTVTREVVRFLEPIQDGLDFDFTRPYVRELVTNALDGIQAKFGPDYQRGRIAVEVSRSGDAIVIKVTDNGQGINEALIADIGSRAFTPEETGKAVDRLRYLGGQGTSLLTLYQSAAEREMEIRAANRNRGEGAEFSLILPERLFLANGDKALLAKVPNVLEIAGESYRLAPLSRQELISNPEYQRLAGGILRFNSRPLSERRMDDDISFAIIDSTGKPVGYRLLYAVGEDSVRGDDFVVAPHLRGTEAAAWLLYQAYYQAIRNSQGRIKHAFWKLDFANAALEQRASTFYRSIGADVGYSFKGEQDERRTGHYSLDLTTGMPLLYERFQRKRESVSAAAQAQLDFQSNVSRLYQTDGSGRQGIATLRGRISRLGSGDFIGLGIVPRWDNMANTLISLGEVNRENPYDAMFRSDGAVTDRMVRGVYTAATRRNPAQLILESPAEFGRNETVSDLEWNQLILAARYLSGYDAVSGVFNGQQGLLNQVVALSVRRGPDTVVFDGTLGELAGQGLRGIEVAVGAESDKAVLSRQRVLEFLDAVTGNRWQFSEDISTQARRWNRQIRRTEEKGSLVFGVLPAPRSLDSSSFDILPLTGPKGVGHAELFGKELGLTNNMVRGTFFKKTERGIAEIVFKSPLSLEYADQKGDVRVNMFILTARFLTGYNEETGEFDLAKAVIKEDYPLYAQNPDGSMVFRGPIREFARRELINTALPSGRDQSGERDSAVLSRPEEVGGIDLTAERLNIEVRRDSAGMAVPVDDRQLQNIRLDGLIPVIINIQPVTNLPLLIGAAQKPVPQPVAAGPSVPPADGNDLPSEMPFAQMSRLNR